MRFEILVQNISMDTFRVCIFLHSLCEENEVSYWIWSNFLCLRNMNTKEVYRDFKGRWSLQFAPRPQKVIPLTNFELSSFIRPSVGYSKWCVIVMQLPTICHSNSLALIRNICHSLFTIARNFKNYDYRPTGKEIIFR